jgi:hypothetical protein
MSMRGPKLRAILEDLDLHVLSQRRTFHVYNNLEHAAVASYDLSEDLAYRFGWVENRNRALGRLDCLSWMEFYAELQQQGYIPKPVVVR